MRVASNRPLLFRAVVPFSAMASGNADKPSGRGALFIWSVVFLLIVYLLSPGPLIAFYRNGNKPAPKMIRWLYLTLNYASENIRVVGAFYDWYLKLWIKKQNLAFG
jgi:hypothetical protein